MDSLVDELLDFPSDIGEDDDENFSESTKDRSSSSNPEELEELEWIINKEAFPRVETFVDMIVVNPVHDLKQQSPISVLENSSNSNSNSAMMSCCDNLAAPVRRARTKRGRKPRPNCSTDIPNQRQLTPKNNSTIVSVTKSTSSIGRKCLHCQSVETPQWRAGPMGPKTLCNACGVRYKSGRLVPEYRPANSPTFSSQLHSNSHRKVVEMRKQKLGSIKMDASGDKG